MRKLKIRIYRDKTKKQWCIQIKSSNGKIVLDAAGYNHPVNAIESLRSVLQHFKADQVKASVVYANGDTAVIPLTEKGKATFSKGFAAQALAELSKFW